MPNSSNTPVVGPNDPEHVWYYDADDDVPTGQPGSSEPARTTDNVQQEGRGHQKKHTSCMQELIQALLKWLARLLKNIIMDASTSKKPQHQSVTIEEVEDEDAPHLSTHMHMPSSAQPSEPKMTASTKPKKSSARCNPIYLFYEQVATGTDGKTADGDKQYNAVMAQEKF
ncbi:hypothetical protein L208DRAFT_1377439 [Tricholoma matsutake]|nr:hypothetical protein L208DRAFT_1377439 [Tricholoma matsutake 945]